MLTLVGAGAVKDAQVEQHYTCTRCGAAFTRILKGEPRKQVWILLNAGQH
jgi:transposase-like protein